MSLIWFDGFEGYSTYADGNGLVGGGLTSLQMTDDQLFHSDYARYSGYGMRVFSEAVQGVYKATFASSPATVILGVAVKKAESGSVSGTGILSRALITFYDGVDEQAGVEVHGSELRILREYNNVLGTTVGAGLDYNVWRYIEIKITIDNSAGVFEVRSNGVVVANLTGIDTQATANAQATGFHLGAGVGQSYCDYYFDDLYVLDTNGAQCNDFLGDVRIDAVRPNGAGTHTDFTPSAGANYENVDEEPGPDDDTTYNEATTIGDQDSYAMESLPSPAGTTILGVKSQVAARKTDAGTRKAKVLTRAGTTDNLGSEESLLDSYSAMADIMEDTTNENRSRQRKRRHGQNNCGD